MDALNNPYIFSDTIKVLTTEAWLCNNVSYLYEDIILLCYTLRMKFTVFKTNRFTINLLVSFKTCM